jgi:hypothetical protein
MTNKFAMYDTFTLNKYTIKYDHRIKTEIFSNTQYYGIIFFMDDGQYEILHNYDMGDRLLINLNNGSNKDVPFKEETFWMLPKGVEAINE